MFKPFLAVTALMSLSSLTHAMSISVDLSNWTSNNYTGSAASGGGSSWNVQGTANDSVLQTRNGAPTVFFDANSNAQGTELAGEITVETGSDDDFIGFVLGYQDGDINSSTGEFYLVDWKQADQSSGSFGRALAGLSISLVTGEGAQRFWGHENQPTGGVAGTQDPDGGNVREIQRAATLGRTGWADNTTYGFELTFTDSLIEVFVDGADVAELSVTPDDFGLNAFQDGAFGFYNYSQGSVRYAGITTAALPDPITNQVPEPGSLALLGLGLLGLARLRQTAV